MMLLLVRLTPYITAMAPRPKRAETGLADRGLMRHLESEDLATSSAEVARLWEDAYTELIELERKMLDRLHSVLPTLSAPARREAELTNLPMLVQHLQSFVYRRAWWRRRREELNGGG